MARLGLRVLAAALLVIGSGSALLAQVAGADRSDSTRAETLARDLAGAQRELEAVRARSALANAAWQEKLSQATRAVEEELAALKARAAHAEADAQRARDALAAVERDKVKAAGQPEKADRVEQSGTTELLAQDLVALRKEVSALKVRLALIGRAEDAADATELPPHSSKLWADAGSEAGAGVAATGSLALTARPGAALAGRADPPSRPDLRGSFGTPLPTGTMREASLLNKAEALLDRGDVTGARSMLEFAVQGGSAGAAFKLAETYDPQRLRQWRVLGMRGDPGKARELYDRALALGAARARGAERSAR
jgi:hypothetical protein